MYRTIAKITIKTPVKVNHNAPFFSMKSPNFFPKINVKYETRKNLSPLVIKHINQILVILSESQ